MLNRGGHKETTKCRRGIKELIMLDQRRSSAATQREPADRCGVEYRRGPRGGPRGAQTQGSNLTLSAQTKWPKVPPLLLSLNDSPARLTSRRSQQSSTRALSGTHTHSAIIVN